MKKSKSLLMAAALLVTVIMLASFEVAERQKETNAKISEMVSNWERAKAYTQEYLNASTDDVINFKPTPETRTFGQQMLHLLVKSLLKPSSSTCDFKYASV